MQIGEDRTKRAAALLLAVGILGLPAAASATIIVSFEPPATTVPETSSFDVVLLAEVSGGDAIQSFGIDVIFDAAVLDATAVLVGAAFGVSDVDLATDGVVDITGFVTPPDLPATGSVTLATISFLAESIGTTSLGAAFPDFPVTDGFGLPFPPGGVVQPDAVVAGSVEVVPEPGAAALLLVGLGLMGAGLRRGAKAR